MPEINQADRLTEMILMQEELQKKMGYNFAEMPIAARTVYIKEYAIHLEHELHEMLAELLFFKPWKRYSVTEEAQTETLNNARAEWADVIHHFLNISIALGLSSEDMLNLYKDKNAVNYLRQKDTAQYKPCVEADDGTTADR